MSRSHWSHRAWLARGLADLLQAPTAALLAGWVRGTPAGTGRGKSEVTTKGTSPVQHQIEWRDNS